MKLPRILSLFFLFSFFVKYGYSATPYSWEKDRKRYSLTESEDLLGEYILLQHHQYDYELESGQFLMYATVHRIVRVNNNEAIERHNRIYIPMSNTAELVELQARSINKNGKVVNFDINNLKEIKDEEGGKGYRIFAIEGVEMGSEIEYFYTKKMTASLFDRLYMQYETPVKKSSFLLSCPKHLKFDFKSYNDYPSVTAKEEEDRNLYEIVAQDIAGLRKETFSYFDRNRKRLDFKLAYNHARSQARLFTWDEAAKTFYEVLTKLTKEDEKSLDKFIKLLKDDPSKDIGDRIAHVERAVKQGIQVSEDITSSSIESIIKYRLASKEGITKLLINVFGKLNINCHPVITCSREISDFDGDFDSWSFLDVYVLYFPDTDHFMLPQSFEYRYPFISPEFTSQQGLFVEPIKVGSVKSALASVKEIPAMDYSFNMDNLRVNVSFDDSDITSTGIKMERTFGGYNAAYFIPYYDMMNEEQRKEMVEEIVKQTAPDLMLMSYHAKPLDGKDGKFFISADFSSTHFIETAGPRILFKIGELIGPQMEMYRDDERTTLVENDFNRGYDRILTVNLPKGYSIKNADDLKMHIQYSEGDNTPFLFISDYTLKDGALVVTIKEYYKEIYAPLDRYEDFRKVINAAADFNKITLVLEKNK